MIWGYHYFRKHPNRSHHCGDQFWFLVTDSLMLGPLQGKYSNISCILCEKKGTSPSKVPAGRGYVSYQEGSTLDVLRKKTTSLSLRQVKIPLIS